jgi:aminopeptidase N
MAAYVKGSVFLRQLGYVIGEDNLSRGLLRYFDTWKFKHPNANDVIRVFEAESGLELDWYKEDWVNTTNTIDYAVASVEKDTRKTTKVVIEKKGSMAMPLDIRVTYTNGKTEWFYAPLASMRGEKPMEGNVRMNLLPDHRWVDPTYEFEIKERSKNIASVEIDPLRRMADIDPENNSWKAE